MNENEKTTDEALQEFLERGGVIQQIKPNVSGRVEGAPSYSAWGRPKKPVAAPVVEAVETVEETEDIEEDIEEDIAVLDVSKVDEE
jgi:hypothetical protein